MHQRVHTNHTIKPLSIRMDQNSTMTTEGKKHKFILKLGAKKRYQRIPSDDLANEMKSESVESPQEIDNNTIPKRPELFPKIRTKNSPKTRILHFITRSKSDCGDKGKYLKLSSPKQTYQASTEEVYSNEYQDKVEQEKDD